jgi:Flp pilus assembly protein TadD
MRRNWFIGLLLASVTALVYAPVADFDFTNLDDGPVIYDNPNVCGGLTLHGVLWALSTSYFDFWHPLTWWSHMLDCSLFGLDPGSHHLMNLGFHVANTLLLFSVLRIMTGAVWRSAMVAALFALHPLHVESVAWLSERKDVLSTFFFMLTLRAYARYAQTEGNREPGGKTFNIQHPTANTQWYYWLAVFLFALGLMSKPMLVTLPFVLLLLDYWPLKRFAIYDLRFTNWQRLLREKWPFFALSAVSSVVTWLGMRGGQHIRSAEQAPWALYLANVPVSYVRYLGKLLWPSDLAALYPMPTHWGFWPVAGSVVLLLLISLAVARRWRSAPWLLTGWLMFLGTLVPVIGLIPNGYQAIADRYTYIPSIGLFMAGVWAVAEFSGRWKFRNFLLPGAAILALLVFGSLTWIQAGYWRNSLTLWTHAVAVTRDNLMARVSLGNALQQAGQINEAMDQYREVLRLNPGQEHANLDLGVSLAMTGQLPEATNYLARALQIRPDWSATHLNLGHALFKLGDFSGALVHFAKAVRLDTNAVVPFTALAGDLSARGKSDDAARYYLEALRLNPESLPALNNLAWLFATQPDAQFRNGPQAVQLAERACELTAYRQTVFVGTLAAAYAEAGRFDDATATARKACDLAAEAGEPGLLQKNRELLALYQAHQPYREPANR